MPSLKWSVPLFVLLACCLSLSAEDGLPDSKELFQQLDENGDGKLVTSEVPEPQIRFFERLLRIADKNEDGQLNEEEFLKAHEADAGPGLPLNGLGGGAARGGGNPKQRFEKLDRNGDGQITKEELPEMAKERLAPLFARLGKESLSMDDFRKAQALLAGGGGPDGEKLFKQLDTNNDGKLTAEDAPKEKAKRMLEGYLKKTGQAPDAMITKADFLAHFKERAQESAAKPKRLDGPGPESEGFHGPVFLRKLDANRDGRLSKEEWAKADDLFTELDANDDDELDLHELMGPRPDGPGLFAGRMPAGKPDGAGKPMPPGKQFFKRMDKNEDGKLSAEEVPPRLKDRFGDLDKDRDGFLTPEEVRDGMPRPGKKPGKPGDSAESSDEARPKRPPAE